MLPSVSVYERGGLFGPDSVTWRVNREAVLLAGGGRALLLQVGHPLVGAGVEQHSDYAGDPWGRLYRTLDLTTRITFGDAADSEKAARRLRGAHRRVNGEAADGTHYDARDPDLLLWVWATLVQTSLLVYQRYVGPLSHADIARYYAEQQRFAVACGVPEGHWPATVAEFTDYFDTTVNDALTVSEDSRTIARSVLNPALPFAVRPVVGGLLNLMTVGLLPPVLRERFELEWGPRREALLRASASTIRRALPLLPSLLREFPAARSARARALA